MKQTITCFGTTERTSPFLPFPSFLMAPRLVSTRLLHSYNHCIVTVNWTRSFTHKKCSSNSPSSSLPYTSSTSRSPFQRHDLNDLEAQKKPFEVSNSFPFPSFVPLLELTFECYTFYTSSNWLPTDSVTYFHVHVFSCFTGHVYPVDGNQGNGVRVGHVEPSE